MTAEKLFIDWLNKQEYWLKALYEQIIKYNTVTEDSLKKIIDCYVRKTHNDIVFTAEEEILQKITLLRLYDVQGVNRLIPNQEIAFGENLTVVYGENGTGKTGYSRIIQQIGKYIGESKPIKPNVFESDVIPKAKIDYVISDGTIKTLEWDASQKTQLNIKLFNSACVHFSLNNERKIDFTPHVFYACEQLAFATSKLSTLVNQRMTEFYESAIGPIIEDTNIYRQVKKILISYNIIDLEALEKTVETLNLEDLSTQKLKLEEDREKLSIASLNAEQARLNSLKQLATQITNTVIQSDFYSNKKFLIFKQNQVKIKELQNKSDIDVLLSQLHVSENIKDAFLSFITEADKLYRISNKSEQGIDKMQTCLLCGHLISEDDTVTRKILQLYGNLVSISQTDSIEKLTNQNHKIEENCKKIIQSLETLLQTPDISSNTNLSLIVKNILLLLKDYTNDKFEIELNQQLSDLKTYREFIAKEIDRILSLINANEEQRKKINIELNEVNAQIDILKNWSQERAYLLSYINLSKIKNINNHGISKCQKDIQEKIYKDSFITTLQNTLSELNAPREVKFNTAISSSKMAIKQGYDSINKENQLSDILSEGEQTVVALAQFIAESKFNPEENILFFDDPVNSLDLKRMQVIANTLVALAKDKQIVIFTHNLVFLGFIKAAIDKNKTENKQIIIVLISSFVFIFSIILSNIIYNLLVSNIINMYSFFQYTKQSA